VPRLTGRRTLTSQDGEREKLVAFLVVVAALIIFFVIFVPVLGILAVEGIVIAVGLYYVIKFAVKAALNESRVKIERDPPTPSDG